MVTSEVLDFQDFATSDVTIPKDSFRTCLGSQANMPLDIRPTRDLIPKLGTRPKYLSQPRILDSQLSRHKTWIFRILGCYSKVKIALPHYPKIPIFPYLKSCYRDLKIRIFRILPYFCASKNRGQQKCQCVLHQCTKVHFKHPCESLAKPGFSGF